MKTILLQSGVKGVNEFRNIIAAKLPGVNIITSMNDTELSHIQVVIICLYVPDFLTSLTIKIKISHHMAGYVGPETQAPYASQVIISFYTNEEANGLVDYHSFCKTFYYEF